MTASVSSDFDAQLLSFGADATVILLDLFQAGACLMPIAAVKGVKLQTGNDDNRVEQIGELFSREEDGWLAGSFLTIL